MNVGRSVKAVEGLNRKLPIATWASWTSGPLTLFDRGRSTVSNGFPAMLF